jgi:hypothetical protein
MKNLDAQKNYALVDGQNLHMGTAKCGVPISLFTIL